MSKGIRKKTPSRTRYEQANPTVSARISREIFDRLQVVKHQENKSYGDIFKAGLKIYEVKVEKEGPIITNVVPHGPPLYEENPDLSPGQTKQVDYAVDGADVTVYRTVYRDGEVLYQDTFLSQYVPWQAIYQVAPGYAPSGAEVIDV